MIKILPDDVITKIAAGEVIERPASAVKELVENAIDAHSTRITVEIEQSGQRLIRITDNGDGMTQDEARLALQRHATSKLSNVDDLLSIQTLGFRGEALPTIAAVSHFTMTTQCACGARETASAWHIQYSAGKQIHESPASRTQGTTIEVKDLFFNTPARKKFLKKDATETGHIIRILDELSLAHPAIHFQMISNGREVLNVSKTNDYFERARFVIGKIQFEKLISFSEEFPWIRVQGLVSKISAFNTSRRDQYLFLNNRPIFNRTLIRALYDSYHGHIPEGRHPAGIFWLKINPELVDVNVHPTKKEVRLANERELYQIIKDTVRKRVTTPIASPVFSLPESLQNKTVNAAQGSAARSQRVEEAVESFFTKNAALVNHALKPMKKTFSGNQTLLQDPSFKDISFRILGQFNRLYVLAEAQDEIWIIDQHAAEERVLFETFSAEYLKSKSERKSSETLLIPFHWEMSAEKFSLITSILPDLAETGIVAEEFGTHSIVVREIPVFLGEIKELEQFLNLLLDNIYQDKNIIDNEIIPRKQSIIRAACRAAVKSRDFLSIEQSAMLIKKLQQCKQPLTCPHGRPTLIRLSKHEIDRRFGR